MTKILGIICILVFFCGINLAFASQKNPKTNMNTYFEKANKLYEKSQFEDALDIYKNLYSQGLFSNELLYNISNSYYRLGKIGYAYLFIERAYRLDPRDEDIRHNRKFILNLLGQKINPMDNILGFLSINEAVVIGLFFYFFLFLFLILGLFFDVFVSNRKLYWIKIGNLCLVIIIACWLFFIYQLGYKYESGIAICSDVPVYASPDIGSKAIFTMPEGKNFIVDKDENYDTNWLSIYVQDKGLKGWLKKENVEII